MNDGTAIAKVGNLHLSIHAGAALGDSMRYAIHPRSIECTRQEENCARAVDSGADESNGEMSNKRHTEQTSDVCRMFAMGINRHQFLSTRAR